MSDPIQAIIDSTNWWGGWGHQNSQLELAVFALEARKAGLQYHRLAPLWELQRDKTRASRGIFLRSPKGEYSSNMANSKDNAHGIGINSWLFDDGKTACEILDNLFFGLWLTGPNEKQKWIDSEWFIFWMPHYRGFMKLCANRKINWIENLFMRINIWISNTHNMKRTRLLFLEACGYDPKFVSEQLAALGNEYRGRYKDDPLYWALWNLQDRV